MTRDPRSDGGGGGEGARIRVLVPGGVFSRYVGVVWCGVVWSGLDG
jgi:hypothetical protein